MGDDYKYWAFISYSHQDRAWGDWLHKTLETYRVPRRLVGRPSRDGAVPARLYPIFRDRDELPSSANLGDALNESLRQSRYQIVICSPRAAASRWVEEEVKYFRSLGRSDRQLCLIVEGEPNVFNVPGRDIEECFGPSLRYPAEPIAADAREHADGKAGAKLKLVAGLIGVGLDEVVQRERQRQFWQKLQIAAAAVAFAGLCVGAWQWYVNQTAAREREIKIERIVESGRLELLEGHQARAAVLLNEAYKMGHDTVPLRFMLGQAMQVVEAVTNVRVVHGGDQVYRATFSQDGSKFALVVSQDREGVESAVAKIYDAATGAELGTLPDAPVLPLSVEFFDEGRSLLVTGYPDSNKSGAPFTYVGSPASPAQLLRLEGINGAAGRPLHAEGSRVLIATESGLQVHDAHSGKRLAHWAAGTAIGAASFNTDGTIIAAAERSGLIKLLDGSSGRTLRTLPGAEQLDLTGVTFSPDGRRLVAFTKLGDVRIWNLDTGLLQIAFAADRDRVHALRFDASGRRFATVGTEGYKVWSAARGVLILFVPKTLNDYASVDLSPDGDTLITADYDNSVSEAWDVRSGRKLYSLDFHADGVSAAAFDANAGRLLLASRDGRAEIWRMPANGLWTYNSFETYPYAARFDREGRRLFAGGGDDTTQGSVLVFDVATRQLAQRVQGHGAVVYDVALNPAQDRVLTASRDGTGGVWDLATGQRLATLSHQPYAVSKVGYSAAANRLLTIADPRAVERPDWAGLWDQDGALIARLGHAGGLWWGTFDSSGSRVVTSGYDAKVRIWDAATGVARSVLSGHQAYVMNVAFSRDGSQVLSASLDRSVRLWDATSGATIAALDDPALGLPTLAVFSPDERQVAIGTQEGKILLWSPRERRTLTLKGHLQRINDLKYSAVGELLFSGSADGTGRAWEVQTGLELSATAWHPAAVNSVDLAPQGLLASASFSRLQITNVAPESRQPSEIEAILRCNAAWRFDQKQLRLEPRAPDAAGCAVGRS